MTKIEEIINAQDESTHQGSLHLDNLTYDDLVDIMKIYAEWYAKECLKIAERESGAFMATDWCEEPKLFYHCTMNLELNKLC
jgi:hypothetical protein